MGRGSLGASPGSQRCSFLMISAEGAARQPRDESVPDPVELVVPAVREELHGQARKVRMLIREQTPHQIRRHLNLGGRHLVHRHNDKSCHPGLTPPPYPAGYLQDVARWLALRGWRLCAASRTIPGQTAISIMGER